MMNQEKIVQVDDCLYPFWTQFGNNRTEDPGKDSRRQREFEWDATELVNCSLELETNRFEEDRPRSNVLLL